MSLVQITHAVLNLVSFPYTYQEDNIKKLSLTLHILWAYGTFFFFFYLTLDLMIWSKPGLATETPPFNFYCLYLVEWSLASTCNVLPKIWKQFHGNAQVISSLSKLKRKDQKLNWNIMKYYHNIEMVVT